jgi:flagellar motor switch protein FliN/FliY
MTQSAGDILRSLAEKWSDLVVQTLLSMTDQQPKVNWSEVTPPVSAEGVFWWKQHLSFDDAALIFVGAPAQTWNELGGRTLRAAGIDTVEEADARNTYLEILSQSLSGLAQAIGSKLDTEVTCSEGAACDQPPAEGHWVSVELVYEDLTLPGLLLGIGPQLMNSIEHAGESRPEKEAQEQALERMEASPEAPSTVLPQSSKTLNLLLDVELPVSVSFGRAELRLKDVLKLTTGSIVELNRGVSEPVEVIVNNCVVARGEVVVMDGNYGVRIHHIISPQERLRTLK